MHRDAFCAVQTLRPARAGVVYEVGSLILNGTVRVLFPDADAYHGIDVVAGPGVDVVADGHTYTPPMAPDTVLCCEVLEHAPVASSIVRQLAVVAAAGAKVIVTCAGPGRMPHSAVDGGPLRDGEYYANVQPGQLADWLERAGLQRVTVLAGIGEPAGRDPGSDAPGDLYGVGYK